ncbi:TSUP family transporter [Litoreibacter ponti]|nr:TSUP family transporter [Litoreibacter ponti]
MTLVICGCAAFIGTVVQRLTGQGFGMIAAPVVALVAPGYLPTALLLVGVAVGLSSAAFDLSAVVRRDLGPGFLGRALGAFIAAALAARLADRADLFGAVVACVVLVAIVLSLVGLRVRISPGSLMLAGTAAGIMGTLTAIGAPPMALLYQHVEQRRAAATQNVFFFFGMAVSLLALWLQGLVAMHHLALAVAISPAVPLGLAASQPLARRVARQSIRPIALALAGCAAGALLLKSLA